MKICVVGAGFVGLGLATLISKKYDVMLLEINQEKVSMLRAKVLPFEDKDISEHLNSVKNKLSFTSNAQEAYENAEYIIVATSTNYNEIGGNFDTQSVENVISHARSINNEATIVIKSTVPVGFTDEMKEKFKMDNLFFSPEFLREGKALYDNLYPSRIIVGQKSERGTKFAKILQECSNLSKDEINIIYMSSKEAEAVKLFSNAYLAMRVSYFNELDTFCESQDLSAKLLIQGVSSDPRIGNFYNNPSFGYGGYCLPKDTKQLLSNFKKIPNSIIKSIVEANELRKDFIATSILEKSPKIVGVYRLSMKLESDNFRESAVIDVIDKLLDNDIKVIVYEPKLSTPIKKIEYEKNFNKFIERSDLILANRISSDLEIVKHKVYSRDIFGEN